MLNKHNIKSHNNKLFNKSLVWNIYSKRLKRLNFLNQRVVEEYKDFDILFYKIRKNEF